MLVTANFRRSLRRRRTTCQVTNKCFREMLKGTKDMTKMKTKSSIATTVVTVTEKKSGTARKGGKTRTGGTMTKVGMTRKTVTTIVDSRTAMTMRELGVGGRRTKTATKWGAKGNRTKPMTTECLSMSLANAPTVGGFALETRTSATRRDQYARARENRELVVMRSRGEDSRNVRMILSNPVDGEFQYNHRPLNEMLVASIKDAMERPKKQKEWDINTFILAPVIEIMRNGQKQWQRLKPKDMRDEDVSSYHWYAVAGQHTAEAAKRLERANSPVARKWGVRSWKARAVYFDDDHIDGYAYISTFDNTRETRSIPSSFRMAVTAIRGLWRHMKCLKGDWHLAKTKDDKVAQQQNYHAFLRKAIRMTPDTELWN
ncbi:hypothetical protein CBR_g32649 [Chara braunii]|uniref:Uncharacterized protein n=1 Tax=Chara braunii TaxID=69332 RepID=A0A388LHD0_CHABU|nr:hypothetical protein CBR_g32649 [Chara braunii]|eukprot:GBG81655.1 hypothetical protein CBR_g32649 [Chara braunii]